MPVMGPGGVSERVQEVIEGHDHDAFVTNLLRAISYVSDGGTEKIVGTFFGVKITAYKAGSIIRIDLQ